jgi:hypothetical protein
VLLQVAKLAAAGKVAFTLKALRELSAVGLGLDPEDACDILMNLTASDSAGRLVSAVAWRWTSSMSK